MAKIKLQANPTFKAKVGIPVSGSDPVPVEFEFKHRTKSELTRHLQEIQGKTDVEVVLEVAVAWELDDEFNEDNVKVLVENYVGAPRAIHDTYLKEIVGAKEKN